MKKEFDEAVVADEAVFKMRIRPIPKPDFLGEPRKKGNKKSITIMLDPEVIDHFKALAEQSSVGYQTLINLALREKMAASAPASANAAAAPETNQAADDLVEIIVSDRKQLRRLKAELETV